MCTNEGDEDEGASKYIPVEKGNQGPQLPIDEFLGQHQALTTVKGNIRRDVRLALFVLKPLAGTEHYHFARGSIWQSHNKGYMAK